MKEDVGRDATSLPFVDHIEAENGIYLPYVFATGGGFSLGDTFVFTNGNQEYDFVVAGFVEEFLLGSTVMREIGFYLPPASYEALMQRAGGAAQEGILVRLWLLEGTDDGSFTRRLVDQYGLTISSNTQRVIETRRLTGDITAMLLIALAVVIVVAVLIQIRFRVKNSLQEDVMNIGVLKAIGYQSHQIVMGHVLQYLALMLPGWALRMLVGARMKMRCRPVHVTATPPSTCFP